MSDQWTRLLHDDDMCKVVSYRYVYINFAKELAVLEVTRRCLSCGPVSTECREITYVSYAAVCTRCFKVLAWYEGMEHAIHVADTWLARAGHCKP